MRDCPHCDDGTVTRVVLVNESLSDEVDGPRTGDEEIECPTCDGTGEWDPPEGTPR